MVIVAATISDGTLHLIVGAVLAVIGASRLVPLSRALGQWLQQRGEPHDRLEGASGIG